MEVQYVNQSNSSIPDDQAILGLAYTVSLIVGTIPLAVIVIFNSLIAIILLRSTSVAVAVRVLLINLLVANLVSGLTVLICQLYSVALSMNDTIEPSLPFCNFVIYVYGVTYESKRIGLVAFSLIVVQIIMCTTRKPGMKCVTCSLVASWVLSLFTVVGLIIPPISTVQYVEGRACFIAEGKLDIEFFIIRLAYLSLWFVIGFSVALLVCIFVPLCTLCYIRRRSISEGGQYNKTLVKLTAFLLAGNVVDFLGLVIAAITFSKIPDAVTVYIVYTSIPLLYIPVPVLIVAFLKPVQKQLCHLLCSKCRNYDESTPMQQDNIE